MAAFNQERFTLATDGKIEKLRNGGKNINTNKSASCWLSVSKTWSEGKRIAVDMEEHEPAELHTCPILRQIYAHHCIVFYCIASFSIVLYC